MSTDSGAAKPASREGLSTDSAGPPSACAPYREVIAAALARAHPAVIEKARDGILADIVAARQAPPPVERCWAIAESYAGIELARLVIINLRNQAKRRAGERIVADLLRLRKDEALFNDIVGIRGIRVPITGVTANLTDPGDPGRKKALARVRRVGGQHRRRGGADGIL